ncbi:MAG: V-type ATP synthase subunit E [Promethearchaeota archaeon]
MTEIYNFENEIIQTANQQAKDIIQKAAQEASKILDQARSEKERINRAVLEKKEKEEEQKAQRELSRLRIRNKIEMNDVKEELLKKVYAESLKRIREWKDKKSEEYRSGLINQILQGGVSLGGGELAVNVAAEDVSLIDIMQLESKIAEKTKTNTSIRILTSEDQVIEGGVIISKGPLSVLNTIEARFDRREEIIRDRVHEILFKS